MVEFTQNQQQLIMDVVYLPLTEGRADWKGFKLGLKGDGNTARSTGEELRGVLPVLELTLAAQLKCIYTDACRMGNKHGKAMVHKKMA